MAGITVDTAELTTAAAAARRAAAEVEAVLHDPHTLQATFAAADPGGPGAALTAAGAEFVQAWLEVLGEAGRELTWFADAVEAASRLYDLTEQAVAGGERER